MKALPVHCYGRQLVSIKKIKDSGMSQSCLNCSFRGLWDEFWGNGNFAFPLVQPGLASYYFNEWIQQLHSNVHLQTPTQTHNHSLQVPEYRINLYFNVISVLGKKTHNNKSSR